MSLPSDVVDKLKQYITEVFHEIKEDAIALFPSLPPKEQEKQVFFQSNSFHVRCFLRSGIAMCGDDPYWHPNMLQSMLYSYDVNVTKDACTFSDLTPIGKLNGTNWEQLRPDEIEAVENNMIRPWTTLEHFSCKIEHEGEIVARILVDPQYADIQVYYADVYHAGDIYQSFISSFNTEWRGGLLNIFFNHCTYTENDGYVTFDFGDSVYTSLDELYPNHNTLFAQKGYPFVGMIKDTRFINQYITDNGSTNNYHTTYTTPAGNDIEVYYGDNYVIYYPVDDEPVSYDDIKNTFNIAINQINDDNDTDIPPAPPFIPPPPEPITDDDYTDMGLGVETDGMAMYNMAVVTRQELFDLITDFEANADTGLSFIPHVLGLYKLGFESSMLVSEFTNDKIRLHKEPQKTAFNSAANYNIVKTQEVVIDCGSITVNREELLTTTFLDFSPYTTYEMFIPGCGWITLPDTIVGRTISVAIVFDLTTCSCKGVVRSEGSLLGGSGTTLATVNGIIGSSVPLSINETGLQRAAIMNGSTQAAMALGTAFMGVGIGNPYMGASGVAMAAGALASNHIAGNSTYTSTKGGATDYSVFGDGWKAVLKITRPVLEIPDNYGHSVGFVVNRYDTLSNFSGFTVCVNPHIHISATSDEKEEIKRLLEEGVILPEGE